MGIALCQRWGVCIELLPWQNQLFDEFSFQGGAVQFTPRVEQILTTTSIVD